MRFGWLCAPLVLVAASCGLDFDEFSFGGSGAAGGGTTTVTTSTGGSTSTSSTGTNTDTGGGGGGIGGSSTGTGAEGGSGGSGATGGAGGSTGGAGGSGATGGAGGMMGTGGSGGQGGSSPVCGNQLVEKGEDCDDGGMVSGDGCSAMCQYDASDGCPPTVVIPLDKDPVTIMGDNSNATGDTNLDCQGNGTGDGKDMVVAIQPKSSGSLTATLSGNFDKVVYVRPACSGNHLACDRESNGMQNAVAQLQVMANQTYYVFVDGDGQSDSGAFTLTLELSVCGDSVVGKGEECDDGNTTNNDNCSSTCQVECPGNADEHPVTHHCYRVFTQNLSWMDARNACLALGPGYDLAALTDNAEVVFVDDVVNPGADTWIGGNDIQTEGTFVWSNGDPWQQNPPWANGEPNNGGGNEDCVLLDRVQGMDNFEDRNCAQTQDYVCELTPAGT